LAQASPAGSESGQSLRLAQACLLFFASWSTSPRLPRAFTRAMLWDKYLKKWYLLPLKGPGTRAVAAGRECMRTLCVYRF
jgi:hypothetical protein